MKPRPHHYYSDTPNQSHRGNDKQWYTTRLVTIASVMLSVHHIIVNHKPSTFASTATERESSRVMLYFFTALLAIFCHSSNSSWSGWFVLFLLPFRPQREVSESCYGFYRAFYCVCQMLDSAEHSVIFFDSCGRTELYLESCMKKVILVVIRNNTLAYSLLYMFPWSLCIST